MSTTITPTTLPLDTVAPIPLPTLISADGTVIIPTHDPGRLVLLCTNTAATQDAVVTITAGDDPPAGAAGQGGYAFTLQGANEDFPSVVCGPLTGYRFLQSDGTLVLTVVLAGGAGVNITAYTLARA